MILDVHVSGRFVAKLYRERDEYFLKNLPDIYEVYCFPRTTNPHSDPRERK